MSVLCFNGNDVTVPVAKSEAYFVGSLLEFGGMESAVILGLAIKRFGLLILLPIFLGLYD